MTTYPLPTLGPTITAAGITVPAYEDILASKQAQYRAIYGLDIDLASDTQDGQFLAIESQAIFDTNDAIVTVFNGFSPTNAQGANLSSLVKINGLQREAASFSTTPLDIVGQAGTIIVSGIVVDDFGNQWTLPPNVVIPDGGAITETGTCAVPGAILPQPGTITGIVTIQPGWQTVNNPSDATLGAPVETDATLRQRQTVSTSQPAQTPLQSILAAVANIPGVERYAIYQNDTNTTDANTLPPHSISIIDGGGDVVDVATAIASKKSPGTATYGTTSEIVIDPSGVPNTIRFYVLDTLTAYFILGVHPLSGYLATTGQLAINAVAAALSTLLIGETAYVNKLFAPANLSGDAALSVAGGLTQQQLDVLSLTYNVTYIYLGTAPAPGSQVDIVVAFNQQANCPAANGSVVNT